MKALQAFMKTQLNENDLQKYDAILNATEFPGIANEQQFAEYLDELYTKLGLGPIRRKFWVDLFCGPTPEIENEEVLREESLFYSKFRLFEAANRPIKVAEHSFQEPMPNSP